VATQANTPNVRLREARESANLTLEQVADLVAGEVERITGKRPAIDGDQVSRYERGLHTWPGRDYRAAFRTVFAARSDAELGFYSRRARARLVPAQRPSPARSAYEYWGWELIGHEQPFEDSPRFESRVLALN
jgi:transcriptional regulator with XRE-family HTH domain